MTAVHTQHAQHAKRAQHDMQNPGSDLPAKKKVKRVRRRPGPQKRHEQRQQQQPQQQAHHSHELVLPLEDELIASILVSLNWLGHLPSSRHRPQLSHRQRTELNRQPFLIQLRTMSRALLPNRSGSPLSCRFLRLLNYIIETSHRPSWLSYRHGRQGSRTLTQDALLVRDRLHDAALGLL